MDMVNFFSKERSNHGDSDNDNAQEALPPPAVDEKGSESSKQNGSVLSRVRIPDKNGSVIWTAWMSTMDEPGTDQDKEKATVPPPPPPAVKDQLDALLGVELGRSNLPEEQASGPITTKEVHHVEKHSWAPVASANDDNLPKQHTTEEHHVERHSWVPVGSADHHGPPEKHTREEHHVEKHSWAPVGSADHDGHLKTHTREQHHVEEHTTRSRSAPTDSADRHESPKIQFRKEHRVEKHTTWSGNHVDPKRQVRHSIEEKTDGSVNTQDELMTPVKIQIEALFGISHKRTEPSKIIHSMEEDAENKEYDAPKTVPFAPSNENIRVMDDANAEISLEVEADKGTKDDLIEITKNPAMEVEADDGTQDDLAQIHDSPACEVPIEFGKRHSTDLCCFLFLIIVWFCLTIMAFYSINRSYPSRLLYPMDDQGYLCGFDDEVADTPYLYPVTTANDGEYLLGVCVEVCPTEYIAPNSSSDLICLDSLIIRSSATVEYLISGQYCNAQYETLKTFNNRCLYDDDSLADQFENFESTGYLEKFATDIYQARAYIFGVNFVVAAFLGCCFIFMPMFQETSRYVDWIVSACLLLVLIAMAIYMLAQAQDWKDDDIQVHESYAVTILQVVGSILIVIACVLVFAVLLLHKKMHKSLQMFREASKVIKSSPVILLVPLLQLVGLTCFLAVWAFYFIRVAGISKIKVYERSDTYQVPYIQWGDAIEDSAWFFAFTFWVTTDFIIFAGNILLARMFTVWFFSSTQNDENQKHVGFQDFMESCRVTGLKHLGTASFSALLIRPARFLRLLLACLTGGTVNGGYNETDSTMGKLIYFSHHDAFVQSAMYGYPFIQAGQEAYLLVASLEDQVHSVGYLPEMVIFLMQFCIACVSAFITYCTLEAQADSLNFLVSPSLLAFFVAYVISSIFMMIYLMGMSTLFQCFCLDAKLFNIKYATKEFHNTLKSFLEQPNFVQGEEENSQSK